jgi:hypothetical protein
MKIVTWDSGFRFDDPNLYWGNPSYLLEPGDPGYVDPNPLASATNKKNKRMLHIRYYPKRQPEQLVWLINYAGKVPGYVTVLGLTTAFGTATVADALWLVYVLQNWWPDTKSWGSACSKAVTDVQTGTAPGAFVLPVFTAPALPTGVTAQPAGALTRIFAAVQQMKASPKMTDAIAADLGIVGSEQTPPDLTAVQPVITVRLANGHAFVGWGWGGYGQYLDSCEIWVDRGDGKGFVFLTVDTTPNYTDTTPLPATPAKWSYKATYRVGENQVGLWSAPVSLTVSA